MSEPADAPLQTCPACGALVDASAVEPLVVITCPKCGEKIRAQRSFDNFQLVETLGVGGMGSVYKARDTRLDRFVALKLLRKDLGADPAEAARLEQEARLTAAINHPHVVQVYSAGHAHDQIYLVMELVDHGSLDDLMAQYKRVPETDALRAGIQVARGLQAAHEKGLVHRDVKPANILFTNPATAKIGDFGLAVAAGQNTEAAREIWGTPYYVAPERLNNEPEDFRSDIYSLGATLFHALAGVPPIEGETTSASELRKLKSNPPDLRAIAPDISAATASVVHQMLAPDPAERFRSYAQLIAALEHAASGDSGVPEKKSRVSLAIIVLLLTLGGLAAAGLYFAQQKSDSTNSSFEFAPSATPADEAEKHAASQKAAEEQAREAERQQLLETESPGWQKALADARAKIAAYDFSAALTAINAAQVTEPSLAEAQSNERKKIEWLVAWKKQLIADLNAKRFRANLEIADTKYLGANKADESEITFDFREVKGSQPLPWNKIPASTLLQISLTVFQKTALDAAERSWLAAVFAAETGQTSAARSLAEAAAGAKPEYREEIPLLFPATPEN